MVVKATVIDGVQYIDIEFFGGGKEIQLPIAKAIRLEHELKLCLDSLVKPEKMKPAMIYLVAGKNKSETNWFKLHQCATMDGAISVSRRDMKAQLIRLDEIGIFIIDDIESDWENIKPKKIIKKSK